METRQVNRKCYTQIPTCTSTCNHRLGPTHGNYRTNHTTGSINPSQYLWWIFSIHSTPNTGIQSAFRLNAPDNNDFNVQGTWIFPPPTSVFPNQRAPRDTANPGNSCHNMYYTFGVLLGNCTVSRITLMRCFLHGFQDGLSRRNDISFHSCNSRGYKCLSTDNEFPACQATSRPRATVK